MSDTKTKLLDLIPKELHMQLLEELNDQLQATKQQSQKEIDDDIKSWTKVENDINKLIKK